MALTVNWLQNIGYSAQLDRQMIEALVPSEGVTSPLSLKVGPTSPATKTVTVKAGSAFIKGDDTQNQGMYHVRNTTDYTTTVGEHPNPSSGNNRLDSICVCVKDPDATGPTGNTANIVVVQGVAVPIASTPVEPTLPSTHIRLANVYMVSSTVTIVGGFITDRRSLCGGLDHVGTIQEWAGDGSLLPTGWLLCDGSEISRTTYAELFAMIGVVYGAGNGSTFNLPNRNGRVGVGAGTGNYTAPVTARALGAKGGAESVTLAETQIPAHRHTIDHDHASAATETEGAHTHTMYKPGLVGGFPGGPMAGPGGVYLVDSVINTGPPSAHNHIFNMPNFVGNGGNTGGGGAHENMMPWVAMNYIIRAA